jgi:DNA-directed RNA polymerase specialized sigma subunit
MIIRRPRILKKIEDEVWREVPETNNRYHVSNYGRVKSFAYNKKDGVILKNSISNGFRAIQIKQNNASKRYYIHKLVAEIWISKPSENHAFVTHNDGNLLNNRASNLSWHTKESLNEQHRELNKKKYGDSKRTTLINNSKLKEQDVILLKSMLHRGITQAKIAKLFCISEMQVTRIKRGENWGHVVIEKSE